MEKTKKAMKIMKANRTKIVATIGPASSSEAVIRKLILAGMNVARLNFSHGTHEDHKKVYKTIRSLSEKMDMPVGILLDLQGPKMRIGKLKDSKPIPLHKDSFIHISIEEKEGDIHEVSTSYEGLVDDVNPGDMILIDDGLIRLKVIKVIKKEKRVKCQVINGGLLKEHKGINLPGVAISTPCLTDKDKEDLNFGLKLGVDFVALSFVRNENDIVDVKNIIRSKKLKVSPLVIAKIERPEAVRVIDEILKETDGIMVARGDLGVELGVEHVPVIQKVVILKSIEANKVVITATQMLESMTKSPMPTRAETSDVANAIFDGTDAVMLSAETASGEFPVESVVMMSQIIHQAETSPFMRFNYQFERKAEEGEDLIAHSIAHAAVDVLKSSRAQGIITFSMSGGTSKLISKQRPDTPIYSFAPNEKVLSRLSLFWGVIPHKLKLISDVSKMLIEGENILIKKKIIPKGDLVVVVRGLAMRKGGTNVIKLHHIGLPY